jgi:SurA N-terminal domain
MRVLRRGIKVSAVVLGAGLLLAGCSPVKVGAAATVGSQRITIAALDTEVTNLSQAVKQYPASIPLTQAQQTNLTLAWLIKFQVAEQLARQQGITVSSAQAQSALAQILAASKANAAQQGISNVTLTLILASAGIPPNLSAEVGRYQAIELRYLAQVNGGKLPSTTTAENTTTAKLNKASCVAAKSLNIRVNPQFGRLDYSGFTIVAAPATVTRAAGPAKAASTAGLTPAC